MIATLAWLFANHQQLFAAGQTALAFGEWVGAWVDRIFHRAEGDPGKITKEMIAELAEGWPIPVPPEEALDPILFSDPSVEIESEDI